MTSSSGDTRRRRFLFCSAVALYPPLLKAAELIAGENGLEGHFLSPTAHEGSPLWQSSGRFRREDFDPARTSLAAHFLAGRDGNVERFGFEPGPLRSLLKEIRPDYVWVHGEFWEGIALQFLSAFRLERRPRIVAYAATNHLTRGPSLFRAGWPFVSRTRLRHLLFWPRLDGVCACAAPSMKCARNLGLGGGIPVAVNYLPVFGPAEAAAEGLALPWPWEASRVIGFAGSLTEQKGWKVLLSALELLPDTFKAVIVGDGEQRGELETWMKKPRLAGRVHYAGIVPKERLLATYPKFDVFVLPSINTPGLVEQFGCVLAEAMACGAPVIGSDSGGIPDAVGDAGLIVPAGDVGALAQAILRVSGDGELRRRATARGRERYLKDYSCEAYARSLASMFGLAPGAAMTRAAATIGKRS